ncbi:uncharacterized protein ACJ7VT_015647 [Polymixia lowei]
MAPLGMTGMLGDLQSLGWSSSPMVGIISLCVFLILSITLLALCLRCRRNSGNAYDVNGAQQTDVQDGVSGTKQANDPNVAYSPWRDHKSMPANTLETSLGSN